MVGWSAGRWQSLYAWRRTKRRCELPRAASLQGDERGIGVRAKVTRAFSE
jgi:hypothetical protein